MIHQFIFNTRGASYHEKYFPHEKDFSVITYAYPSPCLYPCSNALAATYGPYSSITSMPVTAMDYMLCAMELHDTFSQVTYNGVKCNKFTSGSNTVYVSASAFRTTKSRSSYFERQRAANCKLK